MATHTLDAIFSQYTAFTRQGQNVGIEGFDQTSGVMSAATILPGRRCEARLEYRCMCSYEVIEVIDEESVVIEQGEAFALNRSTEGMLLFMGRAPHANQLIEVHTRALVGAGPGMLLKLDGPSLFKWSHTEICTWFGCRRIFGP